MADVFISYSKTHAEVTRRLAEELERLNLTVWWDTELVAGESYRQRIQDEIAAARAAIVVWTPDSITSEFVISEASRAHAQRKLVQVRTADVAITRIPPPFDVSHVPIVEDRKSITGALRKLGLLGGEAKASGFAGGQEWGRRLDPSWGKGKPMLWLAGLAAAMVLAPAFYVGVIKLIPPASQPAEAATAPVPATVPATQSPEAAAGATRPVVDLAAQAKTLTGQFFKQINTGMQDTSLFEADVRLGQRGLSSRSDVAGELRKFTARFTKVVCRPDAPPVEIKAAEKADAGFRVKLTVACDLTERQGKTSTKRFPLEIEAVRSGDEWRIAGMWQPEEMVLWQRRERGK